MNLLEFRHIVHCFNRLLERGKWVLRDEFPDICLLGGLQRMDGKLIVERLLTKPDAVARGNLLLARRQVPA